MHHLAYCTILLCTATWHAHGLRHSVLQPMTCRFLKDVKCISYCQICVIVCIITCRLIVQLQPTACQIPPCSCLRQNLWYEGLLCGCGCFPEPPARCLGIRGRFLGTHLSGATTTRAGTIRFAAIPSLCGLSLLACASMGNMSQAC